MRRLNYRTQKLRDRDRALKDRGGIEGFYRYRVVSGCNTRKEIATMLGMSVPALAAWITKWNRAKKEREK